MDTTSNNAICWIPKGDKIDRIRKTANFISQKTSLNAVPVIISNQDCNTIKKSLQDVIVIDINDINIILELISNNRLNEAKDVMSMMILVWLVIHLYMI